jgi:predicted nucleotidyltransferase
MNKSKVLPLIYRELQKKIGDNLVNVGIGGSFYKKQKPSDIDLIVVLESIETDFVLEEKKILEEVFGCKVSFRLLTPMMMDNISCLDGKTATMLYKGVRFYAFADYELNIEELKEALSCADGDEIGTILRCLMERKTTKDKAIDLLIQLLTIKNA